MHSYGIGDVARLLAMPASAIRSLVARGFVRPRRGPGRRYRFSFQDLIVLRTARALLAARVPQRRINRSLAALRRHLPQEVPLSGLNICAAGDRVVVRTGAQRWQADSGQYLLELDVSVAERGLCVATVLPHRPGEHSDRSARPSPHPSGASSLDAQGWFERALDAEASDPQGAIAAYSRCRALDASHAAAHVNLGRLLHEAGRTAEAERVYREGLAHCSAHPTLLFNLGVLIEDAGRLEEAAALYQQALAADPDFPDAHFNLARLYERLGKPQHAIRHLSCYRRLAARRRV